MGKHNEAISIYNSAIQKFPDHTDAYMGLVLYHDSIGQSEEAMALREKVVALNPQDEYDVAWLHIVKAGGTSGRSERIEELKLAAQAIPDDRYDDAWLHMQLGYYSTSLMERKKEFQIAIGFQEAKLLKSPDDETIMDNLATLNANVGNMAAAIEHLKRATQVTQETRRKAGYRSRLGWLHLYTRESDLALQQFKKAVALSPDVRGFENSIGVVGDCMEAIIRMAGNPQLSLDELIGACKELLETPNLGTEVALALHHTLGHLYDRQGSRQEADGAYAGRISAGIRLGSDRPFW